jgi:hypothetical protein
MLRPPWNVIAIAVSPFIGVAILALGIALGRWVF